MTPGDKFTPGPWWNESGVIHAKGPAWTPENHSCVHPGSAHTQDGISWDESMANADLMAAAPELLALVQSAMASAASAYCPWCREYFEDGHYPGCPGVEILKRFEDR